MFRSPTATRPTSGFSLLEVAIATAILGLVLIALIGLLPSGASNFNKAMDTSIAAQIAQRILHDAEQAEFDSLIDRPGLALDPSGNAPEYFTFRAPRVAAPQWRYYDAQGTEIRPRSEGLLSEEERRAIVYYVNVRIMPRAAMPTINESSSQVAQLTVQIARNPGHLDLPLVAAQPDDPDQPERNLIRTGVVPIYTYPKLVGKNQGR